MLMQIVTEDEKLTSFTLLNISVQSFLKFHCYWVQLRLEQLVPENYLYPHIQ